MKQSTRAATTCRLVLPMAITVLALIAAAAGGPAGAVSAGTVIQPGETIYIPYTYGTSGWVEIGYGRRQGSIVK